MQRVCAAQANLLPKPQSFLSFEGVDTPYPLRAVGHLPRFRGGGDIQASRVMKASIFLKIGLVVSTFAAVGCSAEPTAFDVPETMTFSDPDASAMIAAGQAVQNTLPNFLKTTENPPVEWTSFSVKVAFETRDDSHEHIWVDHVARKDDGYSGVLANEPYAVDGLSLGDEVAFKYTDISDWQYEKDGRLHGNYTTRAMLGNMTPEQRTRILSLLSETPE